ncbi:MAG: aldose 1-epimerase [Gammaproteobacteria bacterium]|jgi:aldose 1-epimerase
MAVTSFGEMPDGTKVERVSLSAGPLSAEVLTYGSVLQDLRLEGHVPSLVLGFERLEHYLAHSPYFGATAGRCANRIRDGRLEVDSMAYQLDQNFLERHHLHGGSAGVGKRIWNIEAIASDQVTLSIELADGEMGYPGKMDIGLTYRLLPEGVLDINLRATTDKTTLCNLAHHSYFNLDGSANILEHFLRIKADAYTQVDKELIPTGEITEVTDSDFDFRQIKPIGSESKQNDIDHNFCLSSHRQKIRTVAELMSPISGISMEIRTTEAGLQVYDGARINPPVGGLDGREMAAYAGIALEPQVWPDAIHHRHFPQAMLHPEETYHQHTQYAFSRE